MDTVNGSDGKQKEMGSCCRLNAPEVVLPVSSLIKHLAKELVLELSDCS